jgi:fused signal recognition particle receptor
MFGFSKRKDKQQVEEKTDQAPQDSWLNRVKSGLGKTRDSFSSGMATALLGRKTLDEDTLEELETLLLSSDVGIDATQSILDNLVERVSRKELKDNEALMNALRETLIETLKPIESPLEIDGTKSPYVILVVGVNGVGKTTTIGKMTKRFQEEGKSVMLAAGDTFRAAAVEQLQTWGERNNVPVIAQHTGADSASVIFDAVQAAKSRGADVLIADTAGRLHNKDNLMAELEKVLRVMKKIDDTAPHEVMLVLDAGTGQNAVSQAESFTKVAPLTGIALTKLDGTAKGGIIFALARKFKFPVRFIGVGEQAEDLNRFNAEEFVDALLDSDVS